MGYIRNNNQGIIALLKRNGQYVYNGMDSSVCNIQDYLVEIESGEYFDLIKSSELDLDRMKLDFSAMKSLNEPKLLQDYTIWERPNLLIDFDDKLLMNYYHEGDFENMVPADWKSSRVKNAEELLNYVPDEFRYW